MIKNFLRVQPHDKKIDVALLIARLGVGGLMLFHGIPKLMQLFAEGEIQFGDPIGLGEEVSFMLAVFAEFFCSILIFFGVATRLAVIPPIITMLVAVFVVHAEDGFNYQELGLHYLLMYLVLLIAGSGKYSLDNWLFKPKQ